jgi:hypothetical protein
MPEILAPAPVEVPRADEPASVPPPPRRPNVVALGLLAVGFGLAVAAQAMPWGSFVLGGSHSGQTEEEVLLAPLGQQSSARIVEVPMTYLSTAHVSVYLITLAVALTAIAVVFAVTGTARRLAAGVAGGMLAANVLVLVGLKSVIDHMSSGEFAFLLVSDPDVQTGPGYLLAYAAALLLAAALVFAVRIASPAAGRLRALRPAEEPDAGEPLELTVTPVPPTFP